MNFHVMLEDKDLHTRKVNDAQGRTVLTACPMASVEDACFVTAGADVHVLLGPYTALSYGVTFAFDEIVPSCTANHIFDVQMQDRGAHQIIIGGDVRIGAHVTIAGGVHIGDGAIVRAGSIITEDVPSYAVAAGNPAQIIGYRFDAETIAALQRIAWWNWPETRIREHIALLTDDAERFIEQCRL